MHQAIMLKLILETFFSSKVHLKLSFKIMELYLDLAEFNWSNFETIDLDQHKNQPNISDTWYARIHISRVYLKFTISPVAKIFTKAEEYTARFWYAHCNTKSSSYSLQDLMLA